MQTSSKNHRSWVTTNSPPLALPQRVFRCCASQATPSMSRWLVGSSNIKMSHSSASKAAKATRLLWPPESCATFWSKSKSAKRPAKMSRTFGLPAHSCSARSPITTWEMVWSGRKSSNWSSIPIRTSLRLVICPLSGSCSFANNLSKVDLPSPFFPTIPMRSPS